MDKLSMAAIQYQLWCDIYERTIHNGCTQTGYDVMRNPFPLYVFATVYFCSSGNP